MRIKMLAWGVCCGSGILNSCSEMYVACLICLALWTAVSGRSAGPPTDGPNRERVCVQLWPQGHGPIEGQQSGDGGFRIRTDLPLNQDGTGFNYTAGQTYQIVIVGTENTFRGFLVQARSMPSGTLIGAFVVTDTATQQTLTACDNMFPDATIAHRNSARQDFESMSLMWRAPEGADGEVMILFTVVIQFPRYFIARNAALVVEQPPPDPTPLPPDPTPLPPDVTPPSLIGADYRLTFRSPAGCVQPNCTLFVGIDTNLGNPGNLDFYVSGRAQSWAAVGFSESRGMFNSDVLGCYLNETSGLVEAADTWNILSERRNTLDVVQDVVLFNGTAEDGVISCTFVRSIAGSPFGNEDRNLNSSLYVMYGVGQTMNGPNAFFVHELVPAGIPQLSVQRFNVAMDTDADRVMETPRDPEDYRLTFRTPGGCNASNCTIFVGIDTNAAANQFLDIYMEGDSEAWLAVGFSPTRDMFSSDVLACNLNPDTGMVEVLDAYNMPRSTRNNVVDNSQDVILFNSSAANGRLSCVFARSIEGNGTFLGMNEDLNLNGSYWAMYGMRPQDPVAGRLEVHNTMTPILTQARVNPAMDNATFEPTFLPNGVMENASLLPENYRLTFREPPGCDAADCFIFVGMNENRGNSSYLDFYMEGASQAWLAVGFSDTRNMFDADALACNLNPDTGMVEVLDTWNLAALARGNLVDSLQDVILFSGESQDGRITCRFTRLIEGSNPPNVTEDLDLNDNLWAMYGLREANPVAGRLQTHTPLIPTLSQGRVNPVLDVDVVANVRDPTEFRLILRDPPGCSPDTCDIYVGIDTNVQDPTFLDFYIQGEAQAWVAVGFSESPNMFDADVVGCNVLPNDDLTLEGIDTWNPASPSRGNIQDNTNDVTLESASLTDGRITCRFTRLTTGSDLDPDNPQDLDLSNDYYALFGVRPSDPVAAGSFLPHVLGGVGNPRVSAQQINPSTSQGNFEADETGPRLIRAHGIMMLIAWPLMAVMAIFFAAWMRPALPNGEWFQVHRLLMSGSIFVASIGFILIFVANRNNDPPGLISFSNNVIGIVHYIIGIVVMALHLLNPIIAICRCKPDGKRRWIFNLIHGTFVGMVAEILALTNVGIGLAIFSQRLSRFQDLTIMYVYLGYAGFFLAMVFILFLVYTVIAYTSNEENRGKLAPSLVKPLVGGNVESTTAKRDVGVELTVTNGNRAPKDSPDQFNKPKVPSKDSPIRWFTFLIFLMVVVVFVAILIILVAID